MMVVSPLLGYMVELYTLIGLTPYPMVFHPFGAILQSANIRYQPSGLSLLAHLSQAQLNSSPNTSRNIRSLRTG